MRDCHLAVISLLAAQALAEGVGEIVLCGCPTVGFLFLREHRQRRFEMRNRVLHVLRAVALDTAPVDSGEVVLQLAP